MGMLRRFGAAAALLLALAVLPVATSCTPQPAPGPVPGPVITPPPAADPGSGGQGTSEGAQDPSQPVQDAGIATTFGGPSQGDQGSEVLAPDEVCKTIGLFWGAQIPDGVTYRVDSVFGADVTDSKPVQVGGLSIAAGPCGEQQAVDCLSATFDAQGEPRVCSVVVRIDDGFHEGTALLLDGTLTCATQDDCNAVLTRDAQEGPAVFVCSPAWLEANESQQACDGDVWKATQ